MRGPWIYGYLLLVLSLGSSSCDPCKRLATRCPAMDADTVYIVRIDTLIEYVDSILRIPYQLPPDTITDTVRVYVQGQEIVPQRGSLETAFARVDWRLTGSGEVIMEVTHKDTVHVMNVILEDLTKEVTVLKDSITVIHKTRTVVKKKIPGIGWVGIGIFISLVLFIVLRLLGKI